MKKPVDDDAANAVIEETLRRAGKVYNATGSLPVILLEADRQLADRLAKVVDKQGPDIRFSDASALLIRKQIKVVQEYTNKRLLGLTHDQAKTAVALGAKDVIALAKNLERRFTGIAVPLVLDTQSWLDKSVRGTGASLLRQHQTSVDRYGQRMIADFEQQLRVGLLLGLSNSQLVDRLVEAGKAGGVSASKLHGATPGHFPAPTSYVKRRYWAERIVRTEVAYAHNAAALASINELRVTQFPDMGKKILAHFDNRTAPDSVAVHGQVRKVDEYFTDGAGRQYLHPPGRPNDRETIIPWRLSWRELPATQSQDPKEPQPQAPVPSKGPEASPNTLFDDIMGANAKVKAKKAEQSATPPAPPTPAVQVVAAKKQAQEAQANALREAQRAAAKEAAERRKAEARAKAEVQAERARAWKALEARRKAEAKAAAEIARAQDKARQQAEAQARAAAKAKARAEAEARRVAKANAPKPPKAAVTKRPETELVATLTHGQPVEFRALSTAGVNASQMVTFRAADGKEAKGVWKPAEGEDRGLRPGIKAGTYYRREVAVANLDRLMGGETIVPVTVSRTVVSKEGRAQVGSVQAFVDGATSRLETLPPDERRQLGPKSKWKNPDVRRLLLLDTITANDDRHDGNIMYARQTAADGSSKVRVVAIDNGLAMPQGQPCRFLAAGGHVLEAPKGSWDFGDQKALLSKLELKQVAGVLADAGIDRESALGTLTRIEALKRDPAAPAKAIEAAGGRVERTLVWWMSDRTDNETAVAAMKGFQWSE